MPKNTMGMHRILAVAAAAIIPLAVACSVTTNTTAVQCTSEAECLSKGPEFAGTTCDAKTRTCVPAPTDQGLCKTNQECIDAAGGAPAICRKRDRKCAPLVTPECPTVLAQPGEIANDNAIVIGAISPAGADALGDIFELSMSQAQLDFAKQSRGLAPAPGTTDSRPLVILSCREFNAGGFPALITAARHLADVGVPIVVGPADPANAAAVATQVFVPANILTILPTGIVSSLGGIPRPDTPLVWSISPTEKQAAITSGALVTKELEPKLRAEGITGPIRVAMVVEDNLNGQSAADLMERQLNFNGKSAAQNSSDGNYLRVNIGDLIDPIGNPAPEAKISAALGAVFGFKPHIIFHSYAPLAIARTFFPLALGWPAGVPLPYHIDTIGTLGAFEPLFSILNIVQPLQKRVFSYQNHVLPADDARAQQWIIKIRSTFPQLRTSPQVEGSIVWSWYDAVYAAAYGIVANGNKPLSGDSIARLIPSLVQPGTQVNTGTDDISKAFSQLGSGAGIQLQGLSGNMDMDPRTGFTTYDVEMSCPRVKDGKVIAFGPSGFYTEKGTPVGNVEACGK
jgi:hypothetical protein